MTEKQQPTIPREQGESFSNSEEYEMSLADLLDALIRKKVLILSVTTVFTLFSIFYAKSITPTYQVSIAFLEPQETYLSILPSDIAQQLPGRKTNNPSIFFRFLSEIMSFSAKEEVFRSGDFLKKFYGENSTVSMESAVLNAHNSISVTKEKSDWIDKDSPEYISPIVLKMEGPKPEAIAEFLTALAKSARQSIEDEVYSQTKELINSKIHQISSNINDLYLTANSESADSAAFYTEQLQIAKELGIKDHNFDKVSNRDIGVSVVNQSAISSLMQQDRQTHVQMDITDNSIPTWYLFGEKALRLEINKYKNRQKGALISGLFEKETLLKKYKSINLAIMKLKIYTLSQPSIPPTTPIKPNKVRIVSIGAGLGLIVGIIIALLCNAINQRKMRIPSTLDN
jgi:LPS O-antigen subunit length determinant protein (WzzB/FepE family)